jgi:hypothetical protein
VKKKHSADFQRWKAHRNQNLNHKSAFMELLKALTEFINSRFRNVRNPGGPDKLRLNYHLTFLANKIKDWLTLSKIRLAKILWHRALLRMRSLLLLSLPLLAAVDALVLPVYSLLLPWHCTTVYLRGIQTKLSDLNQGNLWIKVN